MSGLLHLVMKKQLAAAAAGDRNVMQTLELIYGHITNV